MYMYRAIVTRVVDGDTLDLDVDLGFHVRKKIRCRLLDVDTPEIHKVKKESLEYKAGMRAKIFVEDWLKENGNEVTISTEKGTGKYGRWLTLLWSDKALCLNEVLRKQDFYATQEEI